MNWSSDWGDRPPDADPWSSIVDLMSAFALVLFLAVTFFILNFSQADKSLKQKEKLLGEQQRLLGKREKQLLLSQKRLNRSLIALRSKDKSLSLSRQAREELEKQTALLQQKMAALKAQEQKLLDEKRALAALIQQQQQLVQRQKEETKKQKRFFEQATASQKRCERQLQSLLEQKQKVLTAIYRVFSSRKQKSGSVGFDPRTGKFRLGGDILFGEGKAVLTANGKSQLKQVLQALDRVLLQPSVRPMIEGIMIEGHTNKRGPLSVNWKLSSERALSALEYILSVVKGDPKRYKVYSRLLFAGAFGPFRPVRRPNGTADPRRSRRIEIKVLFHSQKRLRGILQRLQRSP